MIDIRKDKKSSLWIITTRDSEGYHRQLAVTEKDMDELVKLWTEKV